MIEFMSEDFLLKSKTAKKLYKHIKDMPIFDYHCHLSAKEIYDNVVFHNISQLWFSHDHYKWRMMRNLGIAEENITGNVDDYVKFANFCNILPSYLGNSVLHWAYMELYKYFGIEMTINKKNALDIWNETYKIMQNQTFTARKIIEKSNVEVLITTDDLLDDLEYHKLLKTENLKFKVLPCLRLDNLLNIEDVNFNQYIVRFLNILEKPFKNGDYFDSTLANRFEYFIANGAVSIDLSIENIPECEHKNKSIDEILHKKLQGTVLSKSEVDCYKYCLIKKIAYFAKKYNFVMQMHIGALRNQNQRMYKKLGIDCGVDSMSNAIDIVALGKLLDDIDSSYGLPKLICFTHNPNSYYPLATMLGNFAGDVKGKVQLGPAWWMLDNKDGINEQLSIFANTNALGVFNGMLTDSRSYLSYVRHDYFRRLLCEFIAEKVENGEYPLEMKQLKKMVADIAFNNAKRYFSKEF